MTDSKKFLPTELRVNVRVPETSAVPDVAQVAAALASACDGCGKPSETLIPRVNDLLCDSCRRARPASPQEQALRIRRANMLADVLQEVPNPLESLALMGDQEWRLAATVARISAPSLETRATVAVVLYQRSVRSSKEVANVA